MLWYAMAMESLNERKLNIIIIANDFVGPQNACLGFGQHLRDKYGHSVKFCLPNDSWHRFTKYNFTIENGTILPLIMIENENEHKKETFKELVDKIHQYGFVSSISPLDKVRRMAEVNVMKTNFKMKLKQFNGQIEHYLETYRPDLIIYDGEVIPPVILYWPHCPWIYLFCSNPIGLFDSKDLPPFLSDFPTRPKNQEKWLEFDHVLDECYYSTVRQAQNELCVELGYPDYQTKYETKFPFFIHSPYLNIYQYPEELDYQDQIKIPEKCIRIDAFCRDEEDGKLEEFLQMIPIQFDPVSFQNNQQKLIYVSLGSMGSCNLELMQRLIQILSTRTEHYYLISLGPLSDQMPKLHTKHIYGHSYLPQITIFKHFPIDLAIIHGGNNSLLEAMVYGIPVLVLPLFYDQFLNGQRVMEKKVGLQLDAFHFKDSELLDHLDRLLYGTEAKQFKENVQLISDNIQNRQRSIGKCNEHLINLVN